MIRYGIAAAFAIWIVLAIGIYLGLAAANPLPAFRLETLEGDSREGEAVLLRGRFRGPYEEKIIVTSKGSEYDSERYAYERYRFMKSPHHPELEQLVEAYPGFMRGRYHFSASSIYYHDDEWLIRLRADDAFAGSGLREGRYSFQIDLLDKKTGQKRSMSVLVPDILNISKVVDLQKLGDMLQVAIIANPLQESEANDAPELRIYQVSMADGKVTFTEKIDYSANLPPNQEIRLNEIFVPDSTAPQKYLLLQTSVLETAEVSEGDARAANNRNVQVTRLVPHEIRLFIYHYETGKVNSLTLPAESPESRGLMQFYGDDRGYIRLMMTPKEIHLYRYHLPELTQDHEIHLTAEDLQADSIESVAWGDNRLYILHSARGLPAVTAVELSSGNIVYRGIVASEGASHELEKLRISYLTIRS